MVKVWLILSVCILLGFLYFVNEARQAAVSRASFTALPPPDPLAQMQALCRKIHPRQPEMEQACIARGIPERSTPTLTREDFIRASAAICQVQLGYTEHAKITSKEEIALVYACMRAYLAREGIELPH